MNIMPMPWIARGASIIAGAKRTLVWSRGDLHRHVVAVTALLERHSALTRIGLLCDNCPEWVAVDLAAHVTGIALIPLPGFFSLTQMEHVVRVAALDALWCTDGTTAASLGFDQSVDTFLALTLYQRSAARLVTRDELGSTCQKVTFTSGSTGAPKGVCLSIEQQLKPARALADLVTPLKIRRHLNLLPLSLLLENVAGVYVSLMLGATCISLPLDEVGMSGATGFCAERCLDAIAHNAPDSAILLPQMLAALLAHLGGRARRDNRIDSLKFIAVGGGKTSPDLILRAREFGLPVFEGYGLSECGSVVCVNVPFADRIGSVGRPLPHTNVRIAADGEVEVSGRGPVRYLGTTSEREEWVRTGDLGRLDEEGYLFISGRKDNLVVTSFGRNVSPEWPESLLLANPDISHAAIFGEGRPFLAAILSASTSAVSDQSLDTAVRDVNRQLPDYAHIGAWLRAPERFTAGNGMVTANGRLRRDAVWARYKEELNAAFDKAAAQ